MADYADTTTVKAMLDISSTDFDTRLDDLNTVVSRELDTALGLAFGLTFGEMADEDDLARTFLPPGLSDTLRLFPAARSITSVTVDGQTLTEGTDYRLVSQAGPFYGGLYRIGGLTGWAAVNRNETDALAWTGTVVVTGQWADQGGMAVDPLIVEAANVIVAGYFRKDAASDGEVSGMDGLTFRPSNPWRDGRVQRLLASYGRTKVPA